MDLYNIPGDDGKYWRMDKLIEYRQKVDYPDLTIMKEYCKRYDLTKDDMVIAAWCFAVCYNEITAYFLIDFIDWKKVKKKDFVDIWKKYKNNLPFSSSRVYCKSMDWFVPLMCQFMAKAKRHPYKWLISLFDEDDSTEKKQEKIFKEIESFKYMGRFSAELFVMALERFYKVGKFPINISSKNPVYNWKNGGCTTSGMFNILYLDEKAEDFDKYGKLTSEDIEILDKGWMRLKKRCETKGISMDDYSYIFPRLCGMRRLFKSARYPGFHYDRQLEQLKQISNIPESAKIVKRIYKIRKDIYDPIFLGELSGWDGIRKERKKMFIKEGRLGVEEIEKTTCEY